MAKLPYITDSLDDIEETHRALYEEQDGKFVLGVDGIPEPEDTDALKRTLDKERAERKKYEKQIKAWERVGKNPDEIAEMIEAREEAEREKNVKEGNHDAILKQHQTKWAKEKELMEAELNAARQSERDAIIGNSLMAALTKAGATEEGVDLLPDRLANRITFERDGDKRVIRIMSTDGETPLAGSSHDGTATFDDLVKEAVAKYPSLFRGSGAGGSGKQPDKGAGGTGIRKRSDLKSSSERAAFIDEHGLQAYQALPA